MTRSDISSLIQEAERFRIAAQAADWIQAEIEDMIEVSTVAPQPVDWLYPGWIPRGKLTVLFGRPGIGKSHVALDIAARFTTARTMPGCGLPCEAGNVLLFAAEDGVADTIRPRLDAAGANSARVKMFRHLVYDLRTSICFDASRASKGNRWRWQNLLGDVSLIRGYGVVTIICGTQILHSHAHRLALNPGCQN